MVGDVSQVHRIGDIGELHAPSRTAKDLRRLNDSAIVKFHGHPSLELPPHWAARNSKGLCIVYAELPCPVLLCKNIAKARLCMKQRDGFDSEVLVVYYQARLYRNESYLIVYVHIEDSPVRIDVFLQHVWTIDIERLGPIDLGRQHEKTWKSGYVVGMHMAYEYAVDALPMEIQHLKGHLSALPAVKEHKLSVSSDHCRCKEPPRKGLHSACTKYENFQTHGLNTISFTKR